MMKTSTKPAKFKVGGIWEEADWEIRFMEHCTRGCCRCPHAISLKPGDSAWKNPLALYPKGVFPNGSMPSHDEIHGQFLIPRVVVAINKGGYCSTGVCLDCLLSAVKSLDGTVRRRVRKTKV
jgi:hypothetical protein